MRTALPVVTCRRASALVALLLVNLLNAPWQAAVAAPATSKQAAAVVAGWLNVDRTPLGAVLGTSIQRVDTFSDKAGNPLYFIVNLDPAGFVIVPADDLVEPIIGFAATGQFDPSDLNPLAVLVSNDMGGRVTRVRQMSFTPDSAALQAQGKWQQLSAAFGTPGASANLLYLVSTVRVAPFTRSTWDQATADNVGTTACYNYYTPPFGDGNKNNYVAGCVATAMAQLMRYYQFPTAGVGSATLWITNNGAPTTYNLHGGNTFGGPYVWSNMPLAPPSSPPTLQCQAIGALVADAGATVHMSYAASGSLSSAFDAKSALVSNFFFGNAKYGYNGGGTIGAGLNGMINPNLDAGYPVLLSIRGSSGHAVLADGYGYSASTLYHHLNVGWSGSSTAWYALPTIDTGNGTYTMVDGCVYNTYTNGNGEIISGRVTDQLSRPVANATVTATNRTAGGTYTSTTDTNGIYALARIPSACSYVITITKANYSSVSGTNSSGTSSDLAATSGNYWGADFTLPMLTTVLDHFAWNTLAATQYLSTPFAATVTALNVSNAVLSSFNGSVALSGYRNGVGSTNTVVGNLGASQTGTDPITGWTYGYSFVPSTNLQVIAVRTYSGSKVTIWTDDRTFLASQNVSGPSGSWTETPLATPLTLTAGTTYRITIYYPPATTRYLTYYIGEWPTTFPNGTVGQTCWDISGDQFPKFDGGTGLGPFLDLRYVVPFSNSVPISPTTSGAFVNGIWNGNVSVSQVVTNVVLKADDGAGHTGLSSPFNVVDPNALPPRITTQPQSQTNNAGDNATFSLVAASGPTPTYYWRRNGSAFGANASSCTLNNIQLADSGSLFICVVSNTYGAFTSQTAVLTVTCTNVVVAAQPSVTLSSNGTVYAVAPLSDGSVIFGGYFTNVNGVPRSRLAKLLPNGTLDMTWNPAPNASVFALAVNGTALYVGGAFNLIGGVPRSNIAKLSTTGTGVVDSSWDPSANDWVETLFVNGTDVYAGGYFTSIGLQTRSCIAKLSASGTGAADATWNPNATISGDYPVVDSIVVSGGTVYAGGYFTSIGGQTRWCIARLSSSGAGAADSAWDPHANAGVMAVAVNGLDIYVGGFFDSVGGQYRTNLAKLSGTGTGLADASWAPNPDYDVYALAQRGLSLYVGGGFTNIGGLRRMSLAKLSTLGSGAAEPAWQADCITNVWTVAPGNTALYVGGEFTNVAAQARSGIAALTYTPLQMLAPRRPGSQFQCTLSGERGQAYEVLVSSNLVNWDGGPTLTNTTGTTNYTDSTAGLMRRFYRAQQLP